MVLQPPPVGLETQLSKLYNIPLDEVTKSDILTELRTLSFDKEKLLSAIPSTPEPSIRPLHLLHAILTEFSGPWPPLSLIRCHVRLSKLVPEKSKDDKDEEHIFLTEATSKLVKRSYNSFLDFIGQDSRPALRTPYSDWYITHGRLHDFVAEFRLPSPDDASKSTVAIALPNGPLLAAACVAVTTRYIAAPINPATGAEQFQADVLQTGAKFILTTSSDCERLKLRDRWVREKGIEVLLLECDGGNSITVRTLEGKELSTVSKKCTPNHADDIALLLFTSGTSGTKKIVPLTMHSIIAGVIFVVDSWGLTSSDICLNMMPLYHVGGLIRNIFAPIFSGGSTICCSVFDPNTFWDVVQDVRPTWYYASPSMHTVILAEASARSHALETSQIRLVCNAAGDLLPSLACQLRDIFNCVVLPSYGMTECMPISTPPLNYRLDREGTSGISTGPELTILDWSNEEVPPGTVGRVSVRGEPVFPGYLLPDGTFDKSPFNVHGWFDTGDLGYMDDDGYLYITGRSKEVINRGGELISPSEVENAIMAAAMSSTSVISGRVTQALAFSVAHNVLQEVVAVVLVTPQSAPRVDLNTLQSALKSTLQRAKWPVLITYMNKLPQKNNKLLRINLGQRLSLPDISDDTPYLQRHWQAICPPADTALSVPIDSTQCTIDQNALLACLDAAIPADVCCHCRQRSRDDAIECFLAPTRRDVNLLLKSQLKADIRQSLRRTLHNYMSPEKIYMLPEPFPKNAFGVVDEQLLDFSLEKMQDESFGRLRETTEGKVTTAFAEVLSRDPIDIPRDVDFFSLGGDSLGAGRLVSILRSIFKLPLPINIIFNQGTVQALGVYIEKLVKTSSVKDEYDSVMGCSKTYSSTNPLLMLLQLIPIAVVYPLRRAFQWTVFITALSYTQSWPTNFNVVGRLLNVTLCITIARTVIRFVAPFVGIAAKWLIVGRYREGLYPMWGVYHTRWWMTQKIVSICGKGCFNMNDYTKRIYYRLMGAKVGKNVKLSGTSLGEYDLLEFRDGAVLSHCICRPFAAEGNTSMYLGRIVVGENASVATSSIIAPGSVIPPNTCLGFNSSSWEVRDADEENRELSPGRAPKPHWLLTVFLTLPLSFVARFLSLLPWAGGLIGMVMNQPLTNASPLRDILDWFTAAERVAFHYLALTLRTFFTPFILFAFTVLIRFILDSCFGPLGPHPAKGCGAVTRWRCALIKTLLPVSQLHEMTAMFGQHYDSTSAALRMLGAKIGRRVYWPGTGPSIGDYHLLDIGNDVVFGSRSHLSTSDGIGSQKVTIRDGAMIADRVCLLPGVDIGERTVMGSGALTRRGKSYAADAIFVGAKAGDAIFLSAGSSSISQEQQLRSRMKHMSSDETLTSDRLPPKNRTGRLLTKQMGSHDTPTISQRHFRSESGRQSDGISMTSGNASDEDGDDTPSNEELSPFGRAFYLKLAPYYVFGQFAIFCYSSFITVFTALYWNIPSISSIQLVDALMNRFVPREINFWLNVLALNLMTSVTIAILTTLQAILALAIVIGAKWILIGHREPGNYDWDKSSYCQRWQLFLNIEKLRRHCYRGQGILGLLTGTSWLVLYFKALGANIGKDCALFANGRPNLMFTEPDLISLGDRVVVDDASVVAHINTRGKFDLNRLNIGDRCVLRTGSRLLSGATMKEDSCLLEHTLIMGGDTVESRCTMQGWPAENFKGKRVTFSRRDLGSET